MSDWIEVEERLDTRQVERRRPGRVNYANPALIALLRRPEAGPVEADGLPELGMIVDGRLVRPVETYGERCAFIVPLNCISVAFVTSTIAAVRQIDVVRGFERDVVPADCPSLTSGWGPCISDGGTVSRTITGVAELPAGYSAAGAKIVVWLKD